RLGVIGSPRLAAAARTAAARLEPRADSTRSPPAALVSSRRATADGARRDRSGHGATERRRRAPALRRPHPLQPAGLGRLLARDGAAPLLRRWVALAVAQGLVMHAHSDAGAVRGLFALDPRVRVLWAHAGMTAGPADVGAMLDRYPTLWVELALRTDVAPGGP